MAEVNGKPQDVVEAEEEALRKAAQKVVDEAMDEERKRRVSEMDKEISDKTKLQTLDRLVGVQEQLLRQANLAKAKKAIEEERKQRVQAEETAKKKDAMQEQLRQKAVQKELAKGEEEERKRRMEEDKELSDQRAKLYDQVISVQEELLQQFRIKLANLEMKHEQQRQVAIDTKVKMQEELLTEINKKEVKKAVAEEQARQSEELSPEEIQRRVDISNHLTSVHKELLSKRSQVKPINPVLTHDVLEEIKILMQEQLQRKANQKLADEAMDEEQKRRVTESTEPNKDFDEKNTRVKEELTRKASVKEAKKAQQEALEEYMKEEKKSHMQEEAIRQANQKMADKMADVS
jgi:hypothetical protein